MKHTTAIPDTGVVVCYLIGGGGVLFDKAKDFFDKVMIGDTRAIILESVVVESIHVLTKVYGADRLEAARSMAGLLQYRGVVNQDRKTIVEALELFGKKNLGIVDCILRAKSIEAHAELFSLNGKWLETRQG